MLGEIVERISRVEGNGTKKRYLLFVSSIRLSSKHNANDVQQEKYANSNDNSNVPSLSKAGKSNKNFFEVNIIWGRKELPSE